MASQGVLQLKELADSLGILCEVAGSAYGLQSEEIQSIIPRAINEARQQGASKEDVLRFLKRISDTVLSWRSYMDLRSRNPS